MPESSQSRGPALARAAEAMLRSLGGGEVRLRCPVGAAADAARRELGLEGPATEDFAVSPVVVRPLTGETSRFELLFAPATLAPYLADRGQSAEEFFAAVVAVLFDGRTLHIESMKSDCLAGAAYLYRVTAAE